MPKKRSDDMPATFGALSHFRAELKSDVSRLESKMSAGFKEVDAKFKCMDAKLDKMNARVDEINAKTERTLAIVELKQVEFTKLLDAHLLMVRRQDRLEHNMDQYQENMAVILKYVKEKN